MRSLSNNMTEHDLYLSTPKFVSDLLFVADLLKTVERDNRNFYLGNVIKEINKNLPSDCYIPI